MPIQSDDETRTCGHCGHDCGPGDDRCPEHEHGVINVSRPATAREIHLGALHPESRTVIRHE